MNKEVVIIVLIALAGFLIGGVYTLWKTARGLAIVLAFAAVLAAGGAAIWFIGN